MVCRRCKGLLVYEYLGDLTAETSCTSPATRCINCGYIEDSVVRANRLRPPAPNRAAHRRMVERGGVVFLRPHSERHHSV
jgi:hypothetical protein